MNEVDTKAFLEEREKKLGSRIEYKTYALFFAQIGGERREYGVFIYSDGKIIVIEDFERVPTLLGIPRPSKRKEYIKLEISLDINSIEDVSLVTRKSAEKSLSKIQDVTKIPNIIDKGFKKLLTRIKMKDGRIFFIELISHNEFKAWLGKTKKEIR